MWLKTIIVVYIVVNTIPMDIKRFLYLILNIIRTILWSIHPLNKVAICVEKTLIYIIILPAEEIDLGFVVGIVILNYSALAEMPKRNGLS